MATRRRERLPSNGNAFAQQDGAELNECIMKSVAIEQKMHVLEQEVKDVKGKLEEAKEKLDLVDG